MWSAISISLDTTHLMFICGAHPMLRFPPAPFLHSALLFRVAYSSIEDQAMRDAWKAAMLLAFLTFRALGLCSMANVAVGVKLRWDLISFCVRTRYIALLTLFTFTIVWKAAVMRQEHLYDKEDQEAWVPAYAISVAVLEGVVFSFGMPFLLYSGYRNVRIKLSDLDVNMNNDIAFSEVMIFTYKNMPSFLDFANGIGLIVCAICRAVGAENASLAFASVITVLLWCNLTSLLVPSRFFGSLVFIIYRTFVSDITKFLFIYMILNFAFGFSFFLLLQKSTFPQDEKEQEVLCKDCDVYVGKMILKLVYVSLGETDQSILMEHMRDPILAIIMHNVYSVMSLILLLNLIIAMMGDTFQKGFKDSERDWFYPFAELVLRYEKMLPKSKQRFYRVGNTSNRSHKETAGKDAPERGEAATKQVKKLLDPFHVYVKITRGEDDKHPVVIL